jgi:hypothetical protein
MEPEGSLACSQDSATCPYPEPNESNPHPKPYFPKIHKHSLKQFKYEVWAPNQSVDYPTPGVACSRNERRIQRRLVFYLWQYLY